MSEEEEKEQTEKELKNWQIGLLIIFGPLIVGTLARFFLFIYEHIDELWYFITSVILAISDYCFNLMETNIVFYLIFTGIFNWCLGIIIIVVFVIVISLDLST